MDGSTSVKIGAVAFLVMMQEIFKAIEKKSRRRLNDEEKKQIEAAMQAEMNRLRNGWRIQVIEQLRASRDAKQINGANDHGANHVASR
jgi:hypothetical protein